MGNRQRRGKGEEPYPPVRPYESPDAGRRRRTIPDAIRRYYIPLSVLEATDRVMRQFGQENRECYAWWGGYFTGEEDAQVLSAIYPRVRTSFGRIHLNRPVLEEMQSVLRDWDQILVAELHTHPPGAGGQNEVDAAYPAAPYPGFISVVVPDFAAARLYDLRDTYVYEYLGNLKWRQLQRSEIEERFVIEETHISITP